MDTQELNFQLDRTKSQVFLGKNAAFLGSIMCDLIFVWDDNVESAETDGQHLWWNSEWFISLKPETRKTILVHELWHPALLHEVRRGTRRPDIWNSACDYRINIMLQDEGYSFDGIEWGCIDPKYRGWTEEDIYDDLIQQGKPPPNSPMSGDMIEPVTPDIHRQINNVVKAIQQAKAANQAGNIPGHVQEIINKFLDPVVPWEQELKNFFTDLLNEDHTWARPSRRHQDIYLPSRVLDDGRLEHLVYYLDVSGSVSNHDVLRFNSEVKYIKDVFNPKKLVLVQFDTIIQNEKVFEESDRFEEIVVVGRGGTSLVPVREHIIKNRPTAAIIFTDLVCSPMQRLPIDIPVIWVAVNAKGRTVPFGKLIHIKG
ncbi:MAG: VWA-like domain-containing protein [Sphaerochaetaceae bacterium]